MGHWNGVSIWGFDTQVLQRLLVYIRTLREDSYSRRIRAKSLTKLICASAYTVFLHTWTALRRQSLRGFVYNCASKTCWPLRISSLQGNLYAICDHSRHIRLGVVKLRRRNIAGKSVVCVGQKHDCQLILLVAAEEAGFLVQTFAHEGRNIRDEWHSSQSGPFGFVVGVQNLGSVCPVVIGVGGVIIYNNNIHPTRRLQKRPYWVVLVC